MKTSILATLGLCILYASLSNESPVEQPCGHCQSWDEQCYADCILGLEEGPPCGKIKVCIKKRHKPAFCQGIPTTLPQRCKKPGPEVPPSNSTTPSPPPSTSSCSCNGKEFKGPGNYPFGECKVTDPKNGKYYCYVNSNSTGCNDKKKSTRQDNLYYSYKACALLIGSGKFSPDCSCENWDDICWESCLNGIDPNYSGDVATCSCEDWDYECYLWDDNC